MENWNEFDGPLTTLKFGIGFIADYAGFNQDSVSKQQVSGAKNNASVRDFRYTMSGIVKSQREITWKAGINYDGNTGTWRIRETGVQFKMPELSGYIFVGRTKEGYSMQKIQNGFTLWRFERPMIQDLVPILGDGIKYSGFFPKQRLQWTLGAYFNMFGNENQPQTTFKRQITTTSGLVTHLFNTQLIRFSVLLLTIDMEGFWEIRSMCAPNRKSVSHLILLIQKTSGQTLPIVFQEKFITGPDPSWQVPNSPHTIFILRKTATRFLRALFSFYFIHLPAKQDLMCRILVFSLFRQSKNRYLKVAPEILKHCEFFQY